jgi:DNA cross-link repair 1A protein
VQSLELDVPHWITLDGKTGKGVNVTLMDANHCIGSVMFLFQSLETGSILFTGDFRFIPSMLQHPALRNSSGDLIEISHLFLDNTFARPEFQFPPQQVCKEMIFKAIEENPDFDVFIKSECFGRETLLVELAERFNTIVVVNEKMMKRIRLLKKNPEKFSVNEADGFIRVVGKEAFRTLYERNLNQIRTIGICLTGWCKTFSKSEDFGVIRYKIPYSGHSNCEEINAFVKEINPNKITTINSCSSRKELDFISLDFSYREKYINEKTVSDEIPVKRKNIYANQSSLKKVKPKSLGSKII